MSTRIKFNLTADDIQVIQNALEVAALEFDKIVANIGTHELPKAAADRMREGFRLQARKARSVRDAIESIDAIVCEYDAKA